MELLGMYLDEHLLLRWLHIIAMAYWLGGEWGVFNAARNITNPSLTLAERRRHMETAYRIDILPRTGIILLLPLGLHMGHNLGTQPLGGPWLVGMWIFVAVWVGLALTAFFKRGTDLGIRLTKADEAIRYVVIPALFLTGVYSLVTGGPFSAHWYAAKATLFSGLLVIGLILRYVMRDWVIAFRKLAAEGSTPELEDRLASLMAFSRKLAYFYWAGIITMAFLGTVKPF
ncbi:hypothetical protein [Nitrospirillum iridis]|uniref:Urate oxidase N-terminal domain-containing protein n=1 Tax=Nitrospirillum iridis TaxID=765888 RepID=A0A7X0B2L9_9PROT|nr:hypothetical protein [Nitrospirillum iridis]MBB6253074.1 hypothetical protein [Nitrospirillum iridis]